ncbi:FYN-binding protein 1 [Syngnathoides biaculeatus]|uniref:FYN-binding protein 1 n=1 Tax=Syngnathoides biaculeatus TaxID=300417 RepID=UPI002ADE693F|nr:FYN-binding protein 1 [Syngnathoides biaculeatus]
MEESIDVKALRARFSSSTSASTLNTSSRDSNSPKSPRPGLMRAKASTPDRDDCLPKVSATVLPHVAGPDMLRFQRQEAMAPSNPSEPFFFTNSPPNTGARTSPWFSGVNNIKHTGDMLEKMMLRGPAGSKTPPAGSTLTPLPLRLRSANNIIPLRKPLPPVGPLPLKPKRPHKVDLGQFLRATQRARPLPAMTTTAGARQTAAAGVTSPSNPPSQAIKPSWQQNHLTSPDIDVNHDTYDDIASLSGKESMGNSSSQWNDRDENDVYEDIDDDQVRVKRDPGKVVQEQKREKEFRRIFQLQAEEEILHTAVARHDWNGGGKLDLRVHQAESVEILRLRNNPEGKWLARNQDGKYGYISNTCVDVDYEAVKRKLIQSRRTDGSTLPPPPPDQSANSLSHSQNYYDDFHLSNEDFPPPPPELRIDANVEKELRKKFKFDGPLRVLHTVMIDPNAVVKKPGGKDLHVSPGDVLDVVQLTNSKKVLCHNHTTGKYGYVSRNLLIPMEGDVYDDIGHTSDPHDNSAH